MTHAGLGSQSQWNPFTAVGREGKKTALKGIHYSYNCCMAEPQNCYLREKSALFFYLTEHHIYLIIIITCFISSHLIYLFCFPCLWAVASKLVSCLFWRHSFALKNLHDCYNQFILKKNPLWALYCQEITSWCMLWKLQSCISPFSGLWSLRIGFASWVHSGNFDFPFSNCHTKKHLYLYSGKN